MTATAPRGRAGSDAATAAVSLGSLVRRFRGRVAITLVLVVAEAATLLLFPLFIGLAIDDLVADSLRGVAALGVLGLVSLAIGALRRFLDTRTYAAVYETVASEMVEGERERGTETSAISARTTLLAEFVEFLENSMPMIVNAGIGTVGTLVILAGIDGGVFLGAVGLAALVALVYGATGRWNLALTAGYNDELEQQVDAVSVGGASARRHFSELMRWNRRISDLETLNFSIIYLGVIALFVYAPVAVVDRSSAGAVEVGAAFAAVMYVLQYVEAVLETPLFLQQLIRLREITGRLAGTGDPQG